MLSAAAAVVLYGAGIYRVWPRDAAQPSATGASWLAVVAMLCHAYASHGLLFTATGAQLSLVYVVNVVALVIVTVVALASFRLPVHNLFLLIFPIAIVAIAVGVLVDPGNATEASLTPALLAHVLVALEAYSALMMAACQSILLAAQERRLKAPGRGLALWLPPLETMERLLVTMLWIGWVLLTAAIVSGFFFLEDIMAQQVAHHIVITTLSWLVYVGFLVGRYLFGWRGLTAVRWTLVAFSLLVLGYLGSKFVLEYLITP